MKETQSINLPPRKNPQFLSISEFLLGPVIGDGAFAKVRRATHQKSKEKYALKIMRLSTMNEGDIENIEKELEIHSSLSSPFIVNLIDYFQEGGMVYMVLEMISKGNLYQYMYKHIPLSIDQVLKFWTGAVQGIEYLHLNDIYMRDIKPENILIDKDLNIKLCDFGWASRMNDEEYRKLQGGTYIYMSPESLRGELQDQASDMWSLGVLLFELLHYKEPYKIGLSSDEQLNFIQNQEIKFKENLAENIKNIILELMHINKERRPMTKEILKKPWIKKYLSKIDEGSKPKIFEYDL